MLMVLLQIIRKNFKRKLHRFIAGMVSESLTASASSTFGHRDIDQTNTLGYRTFIDKHSTVGKYNYFGSGVSVTKTSGSGRVPTVLSLP